MRITLGKQELDRYLRVAERIVPKKANLPFNYAVHVHALDDGSVLMHVSDGKEAMQWRMRAQGAFDVGGYAIPAEELIKVVAVAPSEQITIQADGSVVRVESGTAHWEIQALQGVEPMEWFGESFEGDQPRIPVDRDLLVSSFEQVRYAASKTELHPSLQQVNVDTRGGVISAGDGRRVHMVHIESDGSVDVNVPERNVDTLIEALSAMEPGDGGLVFMVFDEAEGSVMFTDGVNVVYVVMMLTYPFPDLESLAMSRAREQAGVLVCSIDQLVTALKVAMVGSSENVVLRLTDGVIEVDGAGARAEGRMAVQCTSKDVESGTEITVGASDLMEMLGRIEGGDVTLRVTDGQGWIYTTENEMEAAIRPVRG